MKQYYKAATKTLSDALGINVIWATESKLKQLRKNWHNEVFAGLMVTKVEYKSPIMTLHYDLKICSINEMDLHKVMEKVLLACESHNVELPTTIFSPENQAGPYNYFKYTCSLVHKVPLMIEEEAFDEQRKLFI